MADFSNTTREFDEAGNDFSKLKLDTQKIIAQIKSIPYGQCVSYKEVGNLAGLANGARQVARILHSLSDKYELPWWRVIRSDGSIALTGEGRAEQIRLLRLEGVNVDDLGHIRPRDKSM